MSLLTSETSPGLYTSDQLRGLTCLPAMVRDEFMKCCTRMRQQISMDDEVSAMYECCVLYRTWSGTGESTMVGAEEVNLWYCDLSCLVSDLLHGNQRALSILV